MVGLSAVPPPPIFPYTCPNSIYCFCGELITFPGFYMNIVLSNTKSENVQFRCFVAKCISKKGILDLEL